MADVVTAGPGRVTSAGPHADLPKHAYGSCPVCTRRLARRSLAPVAGRDPGARADVPTRLVVQTSSVAHRAGER